MDWKRLAKSFFKGAGFTLVGFGAVAIPLHLMLKRELKDTEGDIQEQGWPIQLLQVLFARYVLPWMDVKGLEKLPQGSYLVVANHGYKSGVDGFVLGHLLATKAGRVPRILITADNRGWAVRLERWVLHHYGIALLVPDETRMPGSKRGGISDAVAKYLKESSRHAVLIFPAGRAIADPVKQLETWSTGAAVAAEKSGCPLVPVAVGGLRLDWSPETVILAAMDHEGTKAPFSISVRIGDPVMPTGEVRRDLELVRARVAALMTEIPGLSPTEAEKETGFGKVTLRDGRTLAYMDRGPKSGTPVLYFHGFQGSRLESWPGLDRVLEKLNIRLIAPDRPGVGLSTPLRYRTVSGWAQDVRQLTSQVLGPGHPFSILGFSAGATYALGCGQIAGLRAMGLVSGLGLPHEIAGWRRQSPRTWRLLLSAKMAEFRAATFLSIERQHKDDVDERWGKYYERLRAELSGDDARVLGRADVEELFQRNRREGYRQSPGALLQEAQALYSDPGIDLAHLKACTVLLTHGDRDEVVPVEVARELQQRIPGSRLRVMSGRGHYLIYEEFEGVLEELRAAHVGCGMVRGESEEVY